MSAETKATLSWDVEHARGTTTVSIGDFWRDAMTRAKFEVVAHANSSVYSPSSIRGCTPTFLCKALSRCPEMYLKYLRDDGTIEFCGDSIAGAMFREGGAG